ncbi:MAG: hypothetical protein ACYC53_13335, partial [Bacillota bacterium]
GGEVLVYDLKLKANADVAAIEGLRYPTMDPFSWSADGRYWTVGRLMVNAQPGSTHEVVSRDDRGWQTVAWDPTGQLLARSGGSWGPITVFRTGDSFPEGPHQNGFLCGFDEQERLYYISWPDWEKRYQPEWP